MNYQGMVAVAKAASLTIGNNKNLCFGWIMSYDSSGRTYYNRKLYGAPGMAFGIFTGVVTDDNFYEIENFAWQGYMYENEVLANRLYINIANFTPTLLADAEGLPHIKYYENFTAYKNKKTATAETIKNYIFRQGKTKTLFPQLDSLNGKFNNGIVSWSSNNLSYLDDDLYPIWKPNTNFFNTTKKYIQIWEPGFEKGTIFEKEFDLKLLNVQKEPYEALNIGDMIDYSIPYSIPQNAYDRKVVKPLLLGDELKIKKVRCVGQDPDYAGGNWTTGQYTWYWPYVDIELNIPRTGGNGHTIEPIRATIVFELSDASIELIKQQQDAQNNYNPDNFRDWQKYTTYEYSGTGKKTDISVKLPYFGDYNVWLVSSNNYCTQGQQLVEERDIDKTKLVRVPKEQLGSNYDETIHGKYYIYDRVVSKEGYDIKSGYYLIETTINGTSVWNYGSPNLYPTTQEYDVTFDKVKSQTIKLSAKTLDETFQTSKLYTERNNIEVKPEILLDPIVLKHAYEVVVSGQVTNKGERAIDQLGICYKVGSTPTVADDCVANDAFDEIGPFRFDISPLTPNTSYKARVFIKPEFGDVIYSEEVTFTTSVAASKPYIKNKVVMSDITDSGASFTAEFMNTGVNIAGKGFIYAEAPSTLFEDDIAPFPTVGNAKCLSTTPTSGHGVYSAQISGLKKNTLYFVRPYAIYGSNLKEYGTVKMFKTLPHPYFTSPIIETAYFKNLAGKQVMQHSVLTSEGRTHIYRSGIIMLKEAGNTPFVIEDAGVIVQGAGESYSNQLTTGLYLPSLIPAELESDTHYSMRAFSENGLGISYGDVTTFTTPDKEGTPEDDVEVMDPYDVAEDSAKSGYEIYAKVPSNHGERGICWGLKPNPTLADSFAKDTTFADEESINFGATWMPLSITGLKANTTYYVAAYYIDKASVTPNPKPHYSQDKTFTTTDVGAAPTKATLKVTTFSGLTNNACTVKNTVLAGVNSVIAYRGFELSEVSTFATSTKFNDVSSIVGDMTKTFTLQPSKKYYARAYVKTNGFDIVNSNVVEFTTSAITGLSKPTVLSDGAATNISQKSAALGGAVISDGGAEITERGIIYCVNTYTPSISDTGVPGANVKKFVCPGKTGRFVVSNTDVLTAVMPDLLPSTNYRCMLYAINSEGANVCTVVGFRTKDVEIPVPPVVDKPTITDALIKETSFEAIGNVATAGQYVTILERGVCYSLLENNFTNNVKVPTAQINGSWVGSMKTQFNNVSSNTDLWVKTYVRYIAIVNELLVESEVMSTAAYLKTKVAVQLDAPVITKDLPDTTTVLPSAALSLSIETEKTVGHTYQWYKKATTDSDFIAMSGKTFPTLSLTPLIGDNGTKYKVIITANGKTAISKVMTLVVSATFVLAKFESQQSDVFMKVGETFRYTPKVSGTAPIAYKYLYNYLNQTSQFITIPNENKPYLDITAALTDNNKLIRCIINNGQQDVWADSFRIIVNNGVDPNNNDKPLDPTDQQVWTENIGGRIKKWIWYAAKQMWLLAGFELEASATTVVTPSPVASTTANNQASDTSNVNDTKRMLALDKFVYSSQEQVDWYVQLSLGEESKFEDGEDINLKFGNTTITNIKAYYMQGEVVDKKIMFIPLMHTSESPLTTRSEEAYAIQETTFAIEIVSTVTENEKLLIPKNGEKYRVEDIAGFENFEQVNY